MPKTFKASCRFLVFGECVIEADSIKQAKEKLRRASVSSLVPATISLDTDTATVD